MRNMQTFDRATYDSTGVFLVGELERLDQTLNEPLVQYTWSRDIDLRTDVAIYDQISSWTNTQFGSVGTGANPNGKNWISQESTALAGVSVNIERSFRALNTWGMELGWTVEELAAAQHVGRPIDTQKHAGMQLKWNMDIDEQVYIGDKTLGANGVPGLVNQPGLNTQAAAKVWAGGKPDDIRNDINTLLNAAWASTGYAVVPTDLLLPPEQFAYLASVIVSSAGNQSLLSYLSTNTIAYHQNGVPLNIRAVKWLKGAGANGSDRAVAYTKDHKFVRFPMVPLQSIPVQYRGLWQIVTYYGKLGAVEPVYPETIAYLDGL